MARIVSMALALVLVPALAHAERVALMPASGVNLHEGYLQATQDFLRVHLESTGRYEVVTVEGPMGSRELSPQEAMGHAQAVGASLAVAVHVARLGSTARIRLVAYDARTGQIVHRDELAAGSPEDIDPVLARLAKGLATGQRAADTADIHTVTQKEADPLRKQTATNVFGVSIGAVMPVTRAGEGSTALPGMGLFWLYDVRTFLAEVSTSFHSKDGDGDFTVGLGAYYPFSTANTTAFAGGGVRYGVASYGVGEASTGLSFQVTGGVLIGRLSTVQLRGEVSYFVNTFHESTYDGESARASGTLVNVGIGF